MSIVGWKLFCVRLFSKYWTWIANFRVTIQCIFPAKTAKSLHDIRWCWRVNLRNLQNLPFRTIIKKIENEFIISKLSLTFNPLFEPSSVIQTKFVFQPKTFSADSLNWVMIFRHTHPFVGHLSRVLFFCVHSQSDCDTFPLTFEQIFGPKSREREMSKIFDFAKYFED